MIRAAREELRTTAMIPASDVSPFAHHADAYCSYFLLELEEAVRSARVAVSGLVLGQDLYELAQAYTGLGNCLTALCRIEEAREAFGLALTLYRKAKDKGRISVLCSNLAAACLICGDVDLAIANGEESLEAGTRVSAQPVLLRTWSNLAFAYLLSGQLDKAHQCHRSWQRWVCEGRSWAINIDYCCESASFQLAMGNTIEALELIGRAREQSRGRENLVINLGTLERLKVFFAYHTEGQAAATILAKEYLNKFKEKHALAYLESVAATAWLEARTLGNYSDSTRGRLTLFDNPAVKGKRAVLTSQGFL
jgi:tetratricopeptide (TPR) repeat protein